MRRKNGTGLNTCWKEAMIPLPNKHYTGQCRTTEEERNQKPGKVVSIIDWSTAGRWWRRQQNTKLDCLMEGDKVICGLFHWQQQGIRRVSQYKKAVLSQGNRTARCRSCCFWFKVSRQHKSSQASKASLQSSKRTGAKQRSNLTQNGHSRSRVLESVERRYGTK